MAYFEQIIEGLKERKEVEGIMLGGSRATGKADVNSDYDVYVYLNQDLDEKIRMDILGPHVKYMEYGNDFWELEDDGIMKDGIDLELIYRRLEDTDNTLNSIVLEHNAWNGYTTCFWDNLLNSKILYDKSGRLNELKDKYSIPYPKELKKNIIEKNFKLMKDRMPSFYYQIEKAVKRDDRISINHRTTELLSGYFDILFALNETLHPGEKRLKDACLPLGKLPMGFEKDIDEIFEKMFQGKELLAVVDRMIKSLQALIIEEGFKVDFESYMNAN